MAFWKDTWVNTYVFYLLTSFIDNRTFEGNLNGTKKPSAKPGTKGRWPKGKANRVPRVKVLNYLKPGKFVPGLGNFLGSLRRNL